MTFPGAAAVFVSLMQQEPGPDASGGVGDPLPTHHHVYRRGHCIDCGAAQPSGEPHE